MAVHARFSLEPVMRQHTHTNSGRTTVLSTNRRKDIVCRALFICLHYAATAAGTAALPRVARCDRVETLTISSRRSLSSSRAAGDVVAPAPPAPLLPTPPLPGMRASGARRSRRTSSSCRVSASTLATARLSSFSFSLNSARMESRSLPGEIAWKWVNG